MHIKNFIVPIIGFFWIVFQLSLPDLVPELIDYLLMLDNSHYFGLAFLLKATLFVYEIGGMVLFVGGIIAMIVSYRRCQSE